MLDTFKGLFYLCVCGGGVNPKGVGFSEILFKDGCEPFDVAAGNQIQVLGKNNNVLNL